VLIVSVALLGYALAEWLGWLPEERGIPPLPMVLLSASMVLQAVAVLVQRRSVRLSCCLIGISGMLLIALLGVLS
jgi:hypothetical protein